MSVSGRVRNGTEPLVLEREAYFRQTLHPVIVVEQEYKKTLLESPLSFISPRP